MNHIQHFHLFHWHFGQKLNTLSQGQYSQIHKQRTLMGVFRATCLELLKGFSVGSNCGNTHFVRCVRADMDYKPHNFQVCMHIDSMLLYGLDGNKRGNDDNLFLTFRPKWFTNKSELCRFWIRPKLAKRATH